LLPGRGSGTNTCGDRPLVSWLAARPLPPLLCTALRLDFFLCALCGSGFSKPLTAKSAEKGRAEIAEDSGLGVGWFPDGLRDHGANIEETHQRDNPERDHTVDTPHAQNVFLDMGEIQRERETRERGNQQ
jgi:hypothetical protein